MKGTLFLDEITVSIFGFEGKEKDELIDGIGLIVEEVCKNLAFSYLFDCFLFRSVLRIFIIMLKNTPKQQVEINKFLIRDVVV